ncbi:dihydroorotase [Marinobacterium sedimentorum]|uniref:dihydroorotase n=1 Tax=Marinobacterium sedimentorum TaxID=2927804 RepID=UPI0020C5D178|nr:dihydroorotase [Marinobacterium sedimentorum]MCP8689183.1 dihydroorotase [Marinobacterium sedimentorum]
MSNQVRIRYPDDWHLHVRDGEVLQKVLPETTRWFRRAIIMPNLKHPVITTAQAIEYRDQIKAACPATDPFTPLMTLYLTEKTDPADVRQGFAAGYIVAAKLYPAGATTNSAAGVKNVEAVYDVLAVMEEIGMPLLVHGEVVDADIDIFDREAVFIERTLGPVRSRFPNLKIVLEHVTTSHGIDFVKSCAENTAATITPHHLVINRNAMLVGGIKPHYYCLPVAKRESHRLALRAAATSGDSRFFLGTDSAPHLRSAKESACGCAGIFNVSVCLETLATVFEQENALDKLEAFTSLNGPAFYGLAPNSEYLLLEKTTEAQPLPPNVEAQGESILVFDPGFALHWRVRAE